MAESRTVQPQFTYKGFEEELWSVQKSTTFLSSTILSKAMPANAPAGGTYLLQFGLDFNSPNPGPRYLTSHGEGKQLTIEGKSSNQHDQEVN